MADFKFMKRRIQILLVGLLGLLTAEQSAAQTVQLSLPDTTVKRGDTLLVPLRVTSLNGLNVLSGQVNLSFNSGQVQVFGVETAGTLTQGLGNVVFNATTRQFAFATTSPLTGAGDLVKLKVAISGSPSTLSDSIKIAYAVFNEGVPGVSIRNGRVRILALTLSPKNPSTSIVVGDSLQFSVSGDVLPPVTWTSSTPAVGTIDAGGKFRALSVGQLKVFAQDSQGLKDSTGLFAINSASLRSLTMSLRDTTRTRTLTFDLPVTISDVSSLGIISGQFTMTFGGNVLQAVGVIPAGTKTAMWSAPAFSITSGRIDIALAGTTPLEGSGTLVFVRFRVLASAPGQTTVSLSNVIFNENIQANVVNATFTPLAAPILVISPSTSIMTRGSTLQFSVTSGGTPPYTWSSSQTIVATMNVSTGVLTAQTRGTTIVSVVDALGFTASTGSIVVNDIRALLPDSTVAVADSVEMPLIVEDLTGQGVLAYEFRVVYNSSVVRFRDVITPGTMSSSFTVTARDTLDTLRIAAAGSTPLAGAGMLLKIRFMAVATASIGDFSLLHFSAFQFNEPGPSTPTATTLDGRIGIGSLPPSVPVLLLPGNGTNNVSIAPTLTWSEPTGATSYHLQVATTPTFDVGTIVVDQGSIAAATFNLSGLLNSTTYFWRVSAVGVGGSSAYSVAFSFTTVVAPPAAPVANAATGITSTGFVASWSSVSGATEYRLDVSTDNFGTYVSGYENLLVVGVLQNVTGLASSTAYSFRVRAGNVGGSSPNSNAIDVTTLPPPPPAPNALPASNITQSGFTANWDVVTGATGYQLDVSSDNFTTFLAGYNSFSTTSLSHALSGLSAATPYHYRVRAVNVAGPGSNSLTISLTTLVALPSVPVLNSPADLSTGVVTSPTLSWTGGGTGTTYTIEIATSSAFDAGSIEVSQSGLTATSLNLSALQFNTTYFWRVNATNTAGTSAFSLVWSFTTQEAPPPTNPVPTFVSITPPSASRGDTTAIVMTGTNFLATVTTFSFGPDVTVLEPTIQSLTQASARIVIPPTVPTGTRTVFVTNSAPGGGMDSLLLGFTIVNPSPTLTAVLPDTGSRTETLNVILKGSKFIEGVTSVSFGEGFTLNTLTIDSLTSLTANVTISPAALLGPRDITVTNSVPVGGISTRSNGFVVVNPIPTVTSLSPTAGAIGQSMIVTFLGTGFIKGVTSISFGPDITLDSIQIETPTTLRAFIAIASTATPGPRDVSLANSQPGGGTVVLAAAFSLGNAAPLIHAILPDSAVRGQTLSVTILGRNFVVARTAISFSSDIVVGGQTVISDSVMDVQISIPAGAAAGSRSVTVTIAPLGGGSATLTNGFTILNPLPAISSATPSEGGRGSVLNVSIIGSGFFADATSVSFGAGIAVQSSSIISPTELSATIGIDPLADPGVRTVTISNVGPGGGSASLAGGFTINTSTPTGLSDDPSMIPTRYELFESYPNPFNPATTIRFSLPSESSVRLTVLSLLGTEIATLASSVYRAGVHELRFEAGNISTGVYVLRLEARATGSNSSPPFIASRKLLLLR